MKKYLSLFILIILTLLEVGCNKSNYNHLLLEPRYNQAQYRAEIGNLFYETDEKIGITTSFGFFIYNLNEDKLTTAFAVDGTKAFGEEFLVEARLSEDERFILLLGYSHEHVVDNYYYKYDIKTGNLYREEQYIDKIEFYQLPNQDRRAFETNDWTAQDLVYYPPNSNTAYYPFKNIDK